LDWIMTLAGFETTTYEEIEPISDKISKHKKIVDAEIKNK